MTLSEATGFVKKGKEVSRLVWKGRDRVVRKSNRYSRGVMEIQTDYLIEPYTPTINDCMATDWFVVEQKESKK